MPSTLSTFWWSSLLLYEENIYVPIDISVTMANIDEPFSHIARQSRERTSKRQNVKESWWWFYDSINTFRIVICRYRIEYGFILLYKSTTREILLVYIVYAKTQNYHQIKHPQENFHNLQNCSKQLLVYMQVKYTGCCLIKDNNEKEKFLNECNDSIFCLNKWPTRLNKYENQLEISRLGLKINTENF